MIFLKKNPHNDEKHLILVHSDPQFHKEENFQNYAKVIEDIAQLKLPPRQGHSGCRFRGIWWETNRNSILFILNI